VRLSSRDLNGHGDARAGSGAQRAIGGFPRREVYNGRAAPRARGLPKNVRSLRHNGRMRRPIIRLLAACGLLAAAAAWAEPASRHLRFDGVDYAVVDVDLARDRLELHWKDEAGQALASIDNLRLWGERQGRRLLFATNAGIYDRALRPLGLHVEEGAILRPLNTARGNAGAGNFSIQPNGVFYVDAHDRAGVVATAAWKAHAATARLATQSGPMLLVDGAINPSFDEASDSLKWRSGVCAATPQHVVFAVSEGPVSFHAFARLFRDAFGCRDALYLDGTLSRIYTQAEGYRGAPAMVQKPYVGLFAVFVDD
jgi:uncharacterized protein YigE (DUF2233 family)